MKTKTPKRASGVNPVVPTRAFKDAAAWEAWLAKNQNTPGGIWMRLAKKASGIKSITYAEAVEVALCYGWIDALKRPESDTTWLQRFMPRRPKSIWSKINRDKALALIERGQMRPGGLAEIERAKQDGRWDAAYDSATSSTVPMDFQTELDRHPKAKAFFATINATNRYAILWRLQTATKAETRAKRLATFIQMLEKGETIH